ncbi:VOC family protein [Mariniflexile gromovii]|uniref:VOC family protein n=1 Tax=Mariniflexile gromovii TaxID=362523 RepID=A0ABS4BPS8_9FLAO|nr:VOC family protein [Mariniflexile gromovii]MBP0902527.1 VOC family protein [Mariniflexile gromovii]
MTTINPYLIFNGNCEEAFNFYKSVFRGEFEFFGRFNDMPKEDGCDEPMPEEFGNRIMHVSLPIGKNMLMGSDSNPSMGNVTIGQNVNISINTDTKEEADRLFAGLSKEGKVTMPMDDTFWGDYFGMTEDQFGVEWMISFKKPQ